MQYPKLVESKTAANPVVLIEWNPSMDLLATVFSNGALTCSRLLSLQKVWHRQTLGRINSIAWRPDGRVLAIAGYDETRQKAVCTLHDVENGKEIHSITNSDNFTSVNWFQYTPDESKLFKENHERLRELLNTNSASQENFSHQLAHDQSHLNILVASTDLGLVYFYALGLFSLGCFSINQNPETNYNVITITHMSSCLRFITAVIASASDSNTKSIQIMKLDTLYERSDEILRIAKIFAKITDEMEYFKDTVDAITTSWTDVLAGLDNKLSFYCSRKNPTSTDETRSRDSYTFLSSDELLQLLVLGRTSNNLEKFLTDMSDKGLKKLNNAIEQTCLRVQNLIVKNAEKCCYHLHSDLNLLRGMSLWKDKFQDVGLCDESIMNAMLATGSLMLKLTELQQVIDHSLKSTKSFFRWLISVACRMTLEQNNSVVPNDINKSTQQDIQLVTDFILENFDSSHTGNLSSFLDESSSGQVDWTNRPTCSNFTLEQVGQYFKLPNLTRQKYSFAKPNSNFWIEFLKKKSESPEYKSIYKSGSSVLFYPHNAQYSLIEERNCTFDKITGVFTPIERHFTRLLQGTKIRGLDDVLGCSPNTRFRIETDTVSMYHYILFLRKPNPASKLYILMQSLDHRDIFKLISISFDTIQPDQAPPTSKSNQSTNLELLIADFGFYENKETKKFSLSALVVNQKHCETIIVHADLLKIIDSYDIPERSVSEMSRIFRSNSTLDRNTNHISLKLDLLNNNPGERRHKPEMMVKRIKGTIGVDMFTSSGRGLIAFTSCDRKRIHLYELETLTSQEVVDDEIDGDDKVDESLIDTDLIG